MEPMRLAIIIVTFNGSADAIRLLECLERQRERSFAVTVVDNDSRLDRRAMLGRAAASSPLALDLIFSPENRGFAGGCNVGIRKALAQGADWVLLLNPDTTVGEDFISRLTPSLAGAPGIIGLPLDEGGRVAYAGIVRWLVPTLPHAYAVPDGDVVAPYAIGAAMLIHRNVLSTIGLLDEQYFLYFEDADYTMRARSHGCTVRFLTAPVVRHAVSASTRALGSPLLLRYHIRNALLFNRLWGPWWARFSLHLWAFFAIVKQVVKGALMPRRRASARAIAAGIIDYYASRFGTIGAPMSDHRHRM